jgi:hypothetical protein
MAVRLLTLRSGRDLSPGRLPVLIFLRVSFDTSAIVPLEGLDRLKKSSDLVGNQLSSFVPCEQADETKLQAYNQP